MSRRQLSSAATRPSPRARQDVPPPDEISASTQAHDAHFLARTLRCEGADLDRAMRLYHHSEVVRRLMPDLMAFFPAQDRAAIPLRDAPPTPHAILTRDGAFVTCLAPGMAVRDLPVLPYRRFAEAMDQADAVLEQGKLRRRQLTELPPQRLATALMQGPGHVTREMAEIVLLDPSTYVEVVTQIYYRCLSLLARVWKIATRDNYTSRKVEIVHVKTFGRMRLALYLMGEMHTPSVLNLLCAMAPYQTGLEVEMLSAISRHPDGGDRLFELLDHPDTAEQVKQLVGAALMTYCTRNPDRAHQTALRFRHLPLAHDGWEVSRFMLDTFLQVPQAQLVANFTAARNLEGREPFVPKASFWLLNPHELLHQGAIGRAEEFFPPAALAAQVRAAWDKEVRSTEEWTGNKSTVKTVVRQGARIGRNDPCPCGSGRKYKLCCQGKKTEDPGPDPAEIERQKIAEREAFVRKMMDRQAASEKPAGGDAAAEEAPAP